MEIPSVVSELASAEGLGEPLIEARGRKSGLRFVRTYPRYRGLSFTHEPVFLYEEGLVREAGRQGARVLRWTDVTQSWSTMDMRIIRSDFGFTWYRFSHTDRLALPDGGRERFVLVERMIESADKEDPHNKSIRRAVNHVRERVAHHQVSTFAAEIEAGRPVTFGPVTATERGVRMPKSEVVIGWADLREPRLVIDLPDLPDPSSWRPSRRAADLVLQGKDELGDPHYERVPAAQVMNWCALVVLARRLRSAPAQEAG